MADVPDDSVLERFRLYQASGDRTLRNELIEEHRSIAISAARHFAARGEPFDDLEQVALIGVLKAVERFDPDLGIPFVSFARPTVLGELRRHFRDRTWSLRVPRKLKDLRSELSGATEHLISSLGRAPTPNELAAHMRVEVDDVLEALEAGGAYRPASLGTPEGADQVSAGSDALRADDPLIEGTADRMLIGQLLETLPERERRIVQLRFFAGLSQAEIAEEVGLSQVHVSRLLRASLAAMQRRLRHMH